MCRRCIRKAFVSCTGITLVAGWWGVVSLFLTPIIIAHNVGGFATTLGMAGVPAGATAPTLTEAAVVALRPHSAKLKERAMAGENVVTLARDIAAAAGVTPGQVVLFLAGKP
jgi:hypothetical protein